MHKDTISLLLLANIFRGELFENITFLSGIPMCHLLFKMAIEKKLDIFLVDGTFYDVEGVQCR